jgi:hypothetical protein
MDVNGKKLSEIPINPLIFLVKEKKDGVYLEPANT